jgi:hypothetical protein
MIDTFSLLLSHGLILLAAWRLTQRPDLDDDGADPNAPAAKPFWRRGASPQEDEAGA